VKTLTIRTAALSLLAILAACSPPPATDDEVRGQLLARVDQFNESIRDGDVERYADVFVEDFVFTWAPDGQIYSPESILPNVVPTPDHAPIVDEVLVRRYGEGAVLNARIRQQEDEPGVRVTFSFALVEGAWKVLSYQSTQIAEAEG
jgi:hypothetical protein